MNTYEKIENARNLLELPERATMEQIKINFRKLVHKWHPDKCTEDQHICTEKTRMITNAYKTIITYCSQYRYSFTKKEIHNYLSEEEWWIEQFGENM